MEDMDETTQGPEGPAGRGRRCPMTVSGVTVNVPMPPGLARLFALTDAAAAGLMARGFTYRGAGEARRRDLGADRAAAAGQRPRGRRPPRACSRAQEGRATCPAGWTG